MHYIGIDTGGTFTDGVLVDEQGGLFTTKVATTPEDPSLGVSRCVEKLSELAGVDSSTILGDTVQLAHGTTIGTNAVVERKGPRIALIATRGHGDAILMMRGTGRSEGLSPETVFNILETDKPEPLVPPQMIFEVDERVDCLGAIVVDLFDAELERVVADVVAADVDAIAIALLWSFRNPEHEIELLERLTEACPNAFICCSHQVSPTVGEYERTVATVINAYVGKTTSLYLDGLDSRLKDGGLAGDLLILQCGGGVIPVADARRLPLLTIGSGPVGGMIGSADLAQRLELDNVIVTDMGGTSFEVGLIVDGSLSVRDFNVIHQYKYWVPQVDLVSMGSGGGSIAWLDPGTGSLRVGPQSAAAVPGPACYSRGGILPTVTDANLVLGLLRPEAFLGGEMSLDVDLAREAVGKLGDQLGLTCEETAAAIRQIVDAQMGGLTRQQTLTRGHDPRDFTLFAYGGAAPLHAAAYSEDLGVKEVIIPAGNAASVWSAFGAAVSELLEVVETDTLVPSPFPPERLNALFSDIEEEVLERHRSQGAEEDPTITRIVKMRYRGQMNRVEVAVGPGQISADDPAKMVAAFTAEYERLFGQGSSTNQPVEITTVRCTVRGRQRDAVLAAAELKPGATADSALSAEHPVYWPESKEYSATPFYDGLAIEFGASVSGRAIITLPFTTIVVPANWTASRDRWGSFRLVNH